MLPDLKAEGEEHKPGKAGDLEKLEMAGKQISSWGLWKGHSYAEALVLAQYGPFWTSN